MNSKTEDIILAVIIVLCLALVFGAVVLITNSNNTSRTARLALCKGKGTEINAPMLECLKAVK